MLKVKNLVWASLRGRPSLQAHFSLSESGAHGGTPKQVFIKVSVTNY